MVRNSIIVAIAALATWAPIATLAAAPPAGPLYDLKYKFAAGEKVRSEVVHRATIETSIQGTSQTAETRSKSIKVWTVTDARADRMTFVNSVESIDMWQRMQGHQEVKYNSLTDKQVPPGYESAAAAVGKPLAIITIDPRGNVLKREQRYPQPEMQSPQVVFPLPGEPVPVGHVWTAPLEVEVILTGGLPKKIRTQQKFTLEKVADGKATIQVDTQVLTPINDAAIEAQLIQRLSSGTIEFDLAKGRVTAQQLDLDRRVLGFSGPASVMHCLTRYTEKLLPPAETAARKSATQRK